jgi:hypothetical protein
MTFKPAPNVWSVQECAEHALCDGKNAYVPGDQRTPAKFAAKRATAVGTLEGGTIKVESMAAAK